MAGRSSKKKQDNFEKIKKEMTAKKTKAKKKLSSPEEAEVGIDNSQVLPIPVEEIPIQVQEQLIEAVICGEANGDSIPEFERSNVRQVQQDEPEKAMMDDTTRLKLVVFRVNEEEFALRIANIKEIIRIPSITKVPNVPDYIIGLCSLRGSLLPIVNCRRLFGMPDQEFNESSRIIVADIHGKNVGLVSDKVLEVINVEEAAVKEPPASIKGVDGGVLSGMLILDDGKRVVMLLDAEKMIRVETLDEVAHHQKEIERDYGTNADEEEQIVVFHVGLGEYAFNIQHVKEIIRLPKIMKVPNTASYIEGVFSLRNQLLAVIHLGKLLGMDYQPLDEHSRVIIVNTGSFSYGVIVDKVSHVAYVPKRLFKENSRSDMNRADYIKGIYNLNDGQRLVMMLDPFKLISLEEMKRIVDGEKGKTASDDTSLSMGETENSLEYVVFKLGGEEYGIEIHHVQEINNIGKINHFPGAPQFIAGLVELRGDYLPVLDLRKMFAVAETDTNHASKFMVVEYQKNKIGILIDSISGVQRFRAASMETAPEALKGHDKDGYIEKIAKLDNGQRMVMILNLETLLSFM